MSESFRTGRPAVRDVVARSWQRSARAGVPVDVDHVDLLGSRALREYRQSHALAQVFPLLSDVLGRAAEDCDSVLAVGDESGRLLWVSGSPRLLSLAESVGFAEGTAWGERTTGTNAPGTALTLDAPLQIRGGEHYRQSLQQWSCAAAPIHDPLTQQILGVVDVTGGPAVGSPQTLAMVRAAARMAEAELGRLALLARPWPSQAAASAPDVQALGRQECQVALGGQVVKLSRRHSEIMVILADHPDGLTGDQLGIALYETDVADSTMRAELARLRTTLGGDTLLSRPYRLGRRLRFDWQEVSGALDEGRLSDAVRLYRGPLLPSSDAPGVVERRERLAGRLRAAVLSSGDPDLASAWTRSRWGADDLQVWQALVETLPGHSPLHAVAAHEVRRLHATYGSVTPLRRGQPGR